MKTILTAATALITGLFFSSSAIAEDAKPAEWLFVHTAQTAEMTSPTTLVMPATRDIFAFTNRPNRQHGYMNAHEFVSLWDEGEGDTFKADPPNAVLTWVDGDEMKEAELLIISAETVGHGREIAYEVKLLAGETPVDVANNASFFVDGQQCDMIYHWHMSCGSASYLKGIREGTIMPSTADGAKNGGTTQP
jgi:hypothetical protein